MKNLMIALAALISMTAHAGDVTIQLNGGKVSAPSCQTEVQAVRQNGQIELFLNGGDYCSNAAITLNGAALGSKTLSKLFGSYAGDSVVLPENEGMNAYVITFSGKGRSDTITLKVKRTSTATKIDVNVNLEDSPSAELPKCGGTVSADRNGLGDIIVTFNGVDSCQRATILSKNGAAISPPINFNPMNPNDAVRTIGRETLIPGTNTVIYKLMSRPAEDGSIIRETIQVTIKNRS